MNRRIALSTLLLAGLLAAPLAAQDMHPNTQSGTALENTFSTANLDSINLFNGSLTVTIPLGANFALSSHLGYQLKLVYNSNPWTFSDYADGSTDYVNADPSSCSNAGLGWHLSLGQLNPPCITGDGIHAVYESPDGATHLFFNTLHDSDPDDPGDTPTSQIVQYTRDGSYLRLTLLGGANGWQLQFPDGAMHTFNPAGKLTQMQDPFGNWVAISYSPLLWTISDSQGRTQTVYFRSDLPGYAESVDHVVVTAPAGTTATYTLGYQNVTLYRGCPFNVPPAIVSQTVTVPVLTSVAFPDGTSYSVGGTDYNPSTPTGGYCAYASGSLLGLNLRSGGRLEWQYQIYHFPVSSARKTPRQQNPGVSQRQMKDHNGAITDASCVGTSQQCWWTYTQSIAGGHPLESVNTVTDPFGNRVERHFSVATDTSAGGDPNEYGLQVSHVASVTGVLGLPEYLSARTYNTAGTLLRTDYVSFEHDQVGGADEVPVTAANINPRVLQNRTVYQDDVQGGVATFGENWFGDFDGAGHYRYHQTAGNFPGSNVRGERHHYNPSHGTYHVNPSTNQLDTFFIPYASSSPWILNTMQFDYASQDGMTALRSYCFDPSTGFQLRRRIYAQNTTDPATNMSANDLLEVFTATGYPEFGEIGSESHYGGDVHPLPPGSSDPCQQPLGTLEYQMNYTYAYGVRATAQYSGASFFSENRTIDPTGVFTSTVDVSGAAAATTSYNYDALGRITQITPPGETATTYTYYPPAVWGGTWIGPITDIQRGFNGSLSHNQVTFDALGRLSYTSQELPAAWTYRITYFDGAGHKAAVSELGSSTQWTRYLNFDPFGRPQYIMPADGWAHNTTLSYLGTRETDRTVQVATGAGGAESGQTTREIYDRFARLYEVIEPNGVITLYSYNAQDKLTRVCQNFNLASNTCGQTRNLTWDNREFLLSEQHPELGASGNGVITYSAYDSRGHAHQKNDGVNALTLFYDNAERNYRIRESSGALRDLKTFVYAAGNSAGYSNGKVLQSSRFNYITASGNPVTVEVRHNYTYGANGSAGGIGRVVGRQTGIFINNNPTAAETYSVSFTYDSLARLSALGYPQCAGGSCGAVGSRTVNYSYTHNFLTSVDDAAGPNYAALTYSTNTEVNQVQHGNGITDTIAMDPNSMARPSSITTAPAANPSAALWASGTYAYDGVGDVKQIGAASFVYDGMSRLNASTIYTDPTTPVHAATQSYSYDIFGNVQSTTTGGTIVPTPTSSATNRLGGSASYNAAGSLSAWNGQNYSYDAFNQMTRFCASTCLSGAGQTGEDWSYMYDAEGERIYAFKNYQNTYRRTLRDLSGRLLRTYFSAVGTTIVEDRIYRDGRMLASVTTLNGGPSSSVHFSLDHLGTPRISTDGMGGQLAYHAYFPFGQEATAINQDAEVVKFTGQERDLGNPASAADDLDYMHARYFSPLTARFLSLDPKPRNHATGAPQGWNRYVYAVDNPLRFWDPSGRAIASFDFQGQTITVDQTIVASTRAFLDAAARAGVPVHVNSSFRTTAEQQRLYNDAQHNRNPVATPGHSPHEAGFAVDVNFRTLTPAQQQALLAAAAANGFAHTVPGDPPHFTADPTQHGYTSREDAIQQNQADYQRQQDGGNPPPQGAAAPPPPSDTTPAPETDQIGADMLNFLDMGGISSLTSETGMLTTPNMPI